MSKITKTLSPVAIAILILSITLSIISCSKKLEVREERWPNGNLKIKYTFRQRDDGKDIFHGEYSGWYQNGSKEYTDTYNNGSLIHRIKWFPKGNTKLEQNYKNGQFQGQSLSWYESGSKESEALFENGRGLETLYYENGAKKAERNFNNSKLNGKTTLWDENGSINAILNYKDGNLDGKCKIMYANGNIQKEQLYKTGEPTEIYTEWDENGVITVESAGEAFRGLKWGMSKNEVMEFETNAEFEKSSSSLDSSVESLYFCDKRKDIMGSDIEYIFVNDKLVCGKIAMFVRDEIKQLEDGLTTEYGSPIRNQKDIRLSKYSESEFREIQRKGKAYGFQVYDSDLGEHETKYTLTWDPLYSKITLTYDCHWGEFRSRKTYNNGKLQFESKLLGESYTNAKRNIEYGKAYAENLRHNNKIAQQQKKEAEDRKSSQKRIEKNILFKSKTQAEVSKSPIAKHTPPVLKKKDEKGLNVTGVITGAKGKVAIINGELMGKGDTINGYKIINVLDYGVELEKDGKKELFRIN